MQPQPWTSPEREIRRRVVLTLAWGAFLLAISLLLIFPLHLPRWAGNALVVTACTGGACIVYGELTVALARWRLVGK
ncbi:hypothetical protein [Longimicrobium sp.]|uniref:hypothetical protein n=1 Tax=Longimicrobium sp. TaxID=2029185 RepID=UPI002C702549|nr:hypothetical protein [Longimicrobium sp.]HSU17986.1 hypothetical protein [Longimicrobium sp.]